MTLSAQWLLWILLAAWMGLILYLGSSRFGRAGTQAWIDRWRSHPALHGWLNRHHGKFRAGSHYVEFIALVLILYGALGLGSWEWSDLRAAFAYAATCGYAYIDELHQSRTPGRMFRRIDFIHSLAGATIGIGSIFWLDYFFGA